MILNLKSSGTKDALICSTIVIFLSIDQITLKPKFKL